MKKIFNKDVLKAVAFAVVGFVCGCFVDSTIFHIDPIFCGIIEGVLLGGISYAFSIKDHRNM